MSIRDSFLCLSSRLRYAPIKIKELVMGGGGYLSKSTPFNFCIEDNAGDSFNFDFIKEKFNRNIKKYTFGNKDHYLFCGSILQRCNEHSIVIGAGLISGSDVPKLRYKRIVGVRGNLTLEVLKKQGYECAPQFLGDPGLLAREVVSPKESDQDNERIGVIPHFIEHNLAKNLVLNHPEFILIDIKKPFKNVCNEIKKCRFVLSSSLHGLIFSDAMNVPNKWVSFGKSLKGGEFKFFDYYSCTDNINPMSISCQSISDLLLAVEMCKVANSPNYQFMKDSVFEILRSEFS
ncbi:polysaccharide pyruvyl transferase family protein [Marinobacter nauticus]|uniref:polysaccharide pyruvyl transferase family protein n=1 Tax=Marinobacter nauticus TaxID=2743 RepID=UPI003512919B